MQDFVRFRKNTPPEVPPTGCVDLLYDTEAGSFVLKRESGETETLGGSTIETSTGGNGIEDSGKAAEYGVDGNLRSTTATIGPESGEFGLDGCVYINFGVGASSGTITLFKGGSGATINADDITDTRTLRIPDASGAIGILRQYANDTAANAAVSVGDTWWDTTLKKARVRLA